MVLFKWRYQDSYYVGGNMHTAVSVKINGIHMYIMSSMVPYYCTYLKGSAVLYL